MKRVSLKIAERIHNLGYDVCHYEHCWVKTLDDRIIHNSERKSDVDNRFKTMYQQPSFSQLQTWLRKNKNISITVTENSFGSFGFKIIYQRTKETIPHIFNEYSFSGKYTMGFKTYGKALKSGIKESLKIIK